MLNDKSSEAEKLAKATEPAAAKSADQTTPKTTEPAAAQTTAPAADASAFAGSQSVSTDIASAINNLQQQR